MLSKDSLTPLQDAAVTRLYENEETILVADTGVGKTAIVLTAIEELMLSGVSKGVIVAAPAKVVEKDIWAKEAKKWQHLVNLKITTLTGNAKERLAKLEEPAGVYVVSLNNLAWLLDQGLRGVNGIVIDELSKGGGKQTRGLRGKRKAGHLKWRVGLTATPVSQDFTKLFDMARIIDHGKALGTNKERYMHEHFTSDYMGYNWEIRPDGAERIMSAVRDLVYLVDHDKSESLPPIRFANIYFDMPDTTRAVYEKMLDDMVAEDVEAVNEAVLSGKLRQIASGFLYDEEKEVKALDGARRETLREILDGFLTLEHRAVIFYEFVEQEEQIRTLLGDDDTHLVAQIQSMGHGVDGLQHTYDTVIFYQPVWSRDAWQQAYGRVWRTGQTKTVTVYTLMCKDTLDAVVEARVEERGNWMELFKQHLRGEK